MRRNEHYTDFQQKERQVATLSRKIFFAAFSSYQHGLTDVVLAALHPHKI